MARAEVVQRQDDVLQNALIDAKRDAELTGREVLLVERCGIVPGSRNERLADATSDLGLAEVHRRHSQEPFLFPEHELAIAEHGIVFERGPNTEALPEESGAAELDGAEVDARGV